MGGHDVRPPPPRKPQKIGFLSNTFKDLLENYTATKLALIVWPQSAHQRNAILMAFHWRADDGPLFVVFGSSLPLST